jgi:hypothetical protein
MARAAPIPNGHGLRADLLRVRARANGRERNTPRGRDGVPVARPGTAPLPRSPAPPKCQEIFGAAAMPSGSCESKPHRRGPKLSGPPPESDRVCIHSKTRRTVALRIVRRFRNVVRHHHVRIAHVFVDLDRLDEINIPFVGVYLHKSSRCPRILRKSTLKIFSRDPK